MKTPNLVRASRGLCAVLLAAATASSPAAAASRLAVDCPGGAPCSLTVVGHIDAVGSARLPWTASVVVPANICFAVSVEDDERDAPLQITIVTPSGKVVRNKTPAGSSVDAFYKPAEAGWHTIEIDSVPPASEQIFKAKVSLLEAISC